MRTENHVPLERQFSPVSRDLEESESGDVLSFLGYSKPKIWDNLDREYRIVILAEAGAGKTEELRRRASVLVAQDKLAFFIRIEDIDADFYNAFEIGGEVQFQSWLQSTEDAWFFLDSVDEARLENPRAFEKALRRFTKGIEKGAHRAHIYISSRPYAWRPKEDRKLLDEILFLPIQQEGQDSEEGGQAGPQSALTVYVMRPLDEERIRRFCEAREANNIDRLLHEIERANLWSLAERPFDLEVILAKWAAGNALGGRLELLRHNIDMRLCDDHSSDRAQRQPLNLEQAREGARRLAAAVILTGKPGLNVPDAVQVKPGIEAKIVLADWDPKDVRTLLERGIFNDVIYGAVRFRHRDVRELLAAEWFEGLLKEGNSRHVIESLFFREQYGEKIVTPQLRPILPWLILFDDEIRRRSLEIHPEIAVEGGEPYRLPLLHRRKILEDIVRLIVSDEDDRSARDNNAIARIANSDLTEDVQQLINQFRGNDDAIFFLGRLVWQGEMASCVASLVTIAADGSRGVYARIASARAVMTCGSETQKQGLWQKLNESHMQLPRRLLAELVEEAAPDNNYVAQLLISLGKLPPYERYETTGLDRAFHKFVERLRIIGDQQVIVQFLDGIHDYLERPPHVERRECRVSKEYAWLLGPAVHAIERLIEARSMAVFGKTVLSTMLMVPALRHWHGVDISDHKDNLQALVPAWPELNDALYWASIEQARTDKAAKSNEPFIDDWSVSWLGHFWNFYTAGLPRLFDYMCSRELQDDRLVALSTVFRVYVQAGRPAHILTRLQDAVSGDSDLRNQLEILLNPTVSEDIRRDEEEHAEYLREQNEKEERERQGRDTWIAELRADPDRVCNPADIKPGEITGDQYGLMIELLHGDLGTDREEYSNWQAFIPDFGNAVACAYRDAAVNHWRHYVPILRSEGSERDNKIPWSLIFAMAGLEIEAAEMADFPRNLSESEVRHALRYITWQLNGFPGWLERIYQAFPALVEEAVFKEMRWELENTEPGKPMHYILHDVVYYAPWLHHAIAPALLEWMEVNPARIDANRRYCLHILANGGVAADRLAALASQQIELNGAPDSIACWYALRVDCDPENGIPEVEQWLSGLEQAAAMHAAQIFATALMGDRHVREVGPYIGNFRKAKYLKALYVLMHKYIRADEDIKRAGGGVYTPQLRDNAQNARSQLFSLLSKIPGKATYTAIKQLIREHPDPDYRPFMAKQAYRRAEEDGDLEPWSAEQVAEFDKTQTLKPETHRQLYDLTVGRLHDLKNWLERGNDSPYQTWQRVEDETEMRNLIAGWLNQQHHNQYVTAQEPELANSQRMDICLHSINVQSPVPIELKLLDKDWSGPKLCERLRNQLAGDYLREETAGCGVMLLVWRGTELEKHWMINRRRVKLDELADALKCYWQDIADQFPNVEAIDVIVVDLSMRGKFSAL